MASPADFAWARFPPRTFEQGRRASSADDEASSATRQTQSGRTRALGIRGSKDPGPARRRGGHVARRVPVLDDASALDAEQVVVGDGCAGGGAFAEHEDEVAVRDPMVDLLVGDR